MGVMGRVGFSWIIEFVFTFFCISCIILCNSIFHQLKMTKIITTSELQQTIGQVTEYASKSPVVVTNRGRAKLMILPYFDDNDDCVASYLEDFEMTRNKELLQSLYRDSAASGESDLVV